MKLPAREIYELLLRQLKILHEMTSSCDEQLHHVKPHGALYNMSAANQFIAAVIGAFIGAPIVQRAPVRVVQAVVGVALLIAATLYAMSNLDLMPIGGTATALEPRLLWIAVAAHSPAPRSSARQSSRCGGGRPPGGGSLLACHGPAQVGAGRGLLLLDLTEVHLVHAPVVVQFLAFAVTGGIALVAVRPIAKRHLALPPLSRDGSDALVGRSALVTREVSATGGLVHLSGEDWTARPYDEHLVIPPGVRVAVEEAGYQLA